MNKENNSQFEEEVRAIMTVPDMDPDFDARLEGNLVEKMRKMQGQQERYAEKKPRISFTTVTASIIVIMFAVVLAIGPQRVWAAVRSLGFLPGIGYVQDDVRVLDEPVQVQREGTVAEMTDLISDSEHTWLRVVITGKLEHDLSMEDQCFLNPSLQFDGAEDISVIWSSTTVKADEIVLEIGFPILPAELADGVMNMPCLPGVPSEINGEDWQFPFLLSQPTEDEKPYVAEYLSNSTETAEALPSPEINKEAGVQLVVENVTELEDGYQFMGSVSVPNNAEVSFESDSITLQTQDGNTIELQPVDIPFGSGVPIVDQPWVVRTTTKDIPAQLVFTLNALAFKRSDEYVREQSVVIDLGSDPQPGQSWTIEQSISVAGSEVKFHDVRLEQVTDEVYLLIFTVEYPQEEIYAVDLDDADHPAEDMRAGSGGGGGGGEGNNPNLRLESISYNRIPTGQRTIFVSDAYIVQRGNWSTTIQLPE
jgi:hypothetical protein